MENKNALLCFAIFLIVLFILVKFSSGESDTINLAKGKNKIAFTLDFNLSAFELINLNPSIEVISFNLNNRSIGYVNIFGGIGENFQMEKGREYEIISSEDIKLFIPEKS